MTKEMFVDIVRTILKAVGGYWVASGVITGTDSDAIVGAAAVIAGLLWSWWSTHKMENANG